MTVIYCVSDGKTILDTFVTVEEANSLVYSTKKMAANIQLLADAGVPETMRSQQYSYMFSQYNNILGITEQNIQTAIDALTEPHVEEKVIV